MDPLKSVGLRQAFKNVRAPKAQWRTVAAGFDGDVWPEVTPSFRLHPGDMVFTIGSCFARNIEEHLARLGCRVPMLDFVLPDSEWHGPPNHALNKFTPPSFSQALAWTAAVIDHGGRVTWEDCDPLAFDCGEDSFYDLDLAPAVPVSKARFLERRQQVFEVFKTAFEAQCLMMTPGYVEAWKDLKTGLYIQGAPINRRVIEDAERFQFEVLGFETILAHLTAALDIVRARNPGIKALITTSPVPLGKSFTGEDIRIANMQSKSLLRAACGALTCQRPEVDYFPSYESVMLSSPAKVWSKDRIHVAPGFVGKIVARLLSSYMDSLPPGAAQHQMAETLLLDGDVSGALEVIEQALQARPDDLAVRQTKLDALMASGRYAEAEALARAITCGGPAHAATWGELARAIFLQDRRRKGEALEAIEAACAAPDAQPQDYAFALKLLVKLGRPADAERLAREAIDRFPLKPLAHQLLVNLLVGAGRRGEAIETLRVACELPLREAGQFAQLAELLIEAGQVEEARDLARRAIKLNPDNKRVRQLRKQLDLIA